MTPAPADFDVAIVGAGAAGLATAIFTLQHAPGMRVAVLDGARRPGAKILVSGGSRCNVTNAVVTEADFNGGRPTIIRQILRALPVRDTIAFFADLGVALHEEPHGKLFPDSNRSRDVLDALLRDLERRGGSLLTEQRVLDVAQRHHSFDITTSAGVVTASAVVLATGGLSLPKTGSDGAGYGLARRFGHTIVATTPALAPLLLAAPAPQPAATVARPAAPLPGIHQELSGVAQETRLDLRLDGVVAARVRGAMLWTHFGISGPAVLDVSRHWLRGRLEGRTAELTASLFPRHTFESLERTWMALAREQPRLSLRAALAGMLPGSVAAAVLGQLALPCDGTLATLPRAERRRLVQSTLEWPLPVADSRGYSFAEATAGGVDLREVNPSSMASRCCAGLYLVGELLDVDGRLGGFNFQWAWATARVAGGALGQRRPAPP